MFIQTLFMHGHIMMWHHDIALCMGIPLEEE